MEILNGWNNTNGQNPEKKVKSLNQILLISFFNKNKDIMFDKLMAAQQKAEEIKKRLDTVSVFAEVEGGAIKVTSTANKTITAIEINEDFFKGADKEELEELLLTAINKVLVQAENVSATEMQSATQDMLGGLGGMFGN